MSALRSIRRRTSLPVRLSGSPAVRRTDDDTEHEIFVLAREHGLGRGKVARVGAGVRGGLAV